MSEALSHLFGDYVVQSDWMAVEKTSRHLPATLHAACYAACFLPVTRSSRALAVIGGTHFLIDRYRLARYVVWAKNQLAPAEWRHAWNNHVDRTGYHTPDVTWVDAHGVTRVVHDDCIRQGKPEWLALPLLIVADNALHLLINRWAIRRFR